LTDFDKLGAELDSADTLAPMRELFHRPEGAVYLDGNSLGLMPKSVPARIRSVMEDEWAEGLIQSWAKADWFHLPVSVGNKIAPLVGAGQDEIAVGDSTSVNLFKCLAAALHLNPQRRVVLAEGDNFPTDSYMAQGLADLVPDVELRYMEAGEEPASMVDENVAVVLLSHVDYRSALIRDMSSVTKAVQAKGASLVWDLSHTTGAVACDLAGCNVDFAVGCTYKYLNGGPGAPAFTWVNPVHARKLKQPLSGWMGHAAPFDFARDFDPADGARRMVCGTPQVLSLSSLDEAMNVWNGVDLDSLWSKSRTMTSFFIDAVEELCAGHGLELGCSRDARERGSHVPFMRGSGGYEIMQAMAARGVQGDFRTPTTLRFGFAPLYLSFADVLTGVRHLAEILDTGEWDDDRFRIRDVIT